MLYTIVPPEDIFGEPAPVAGGGSTIEVEHEGRYLVFQVDQGGQARLVRLISTNPSDYLNSLLQPGGSIPWALTLRNPPPFGRVFPK